MSNRRPAIACPACGKKVKRLRSGKLANHKYMGRPHDPENCPRSNTGVTAGELFRAEFSGGVQAHE